MSFLENKPELYPMDYQDGILNKGLKFEKNVDHYVKWLGKNTRVVAFYHGREEYKDDINELRKVAEKNSNRLNLRIAYVTDTHLIAKLKKKYEHLFFDVGMSSMVLVRYDGFIQKLDLADSPITQYNRFINTKSMKPVEELTEAAYQITEAASMPMMMLFMDFESQDPAVVKKCQRLLSVMEEIAPVFEHLFKVYWTQDPN